MEGSEASYHVVHNTILSGVLGGSRAYVIVSISAFLVNIAIRVAPR